MRAVLRTLAGVAAITLIVYGMLPGIPERNWLPCLWGATVLGGFAIWPQRRQRATGILGGTQNLAMVMLIGFTMLTVQLLYTQVIKARSIYTRSVIDDSGQPVSNVRTTTSSMKVKRGAIYDSQGTLLVDSAVTSDDFSHRIYPVADSYNIEAFAHVLGFASTAYGLSGIEETYDDYLTGQRGNSWQTVQNSLLNRPQEGNSIQLTINAELQQRAYDALAGRTGSVVVLDANTGAIRAMVSYPAFDPRQLTLDTGVDNWTAQTEQMTEYWNGLIGENSGFPLLNRATQGQYPPGSTYKTVTAVGVLNNPEIGKPDEIKCPERFKADPQLTDDLAVRNAVDGEEGYIISKHGPNYGLDAVYAFSCNTAFAQYGLRLEEDNRGLLVQQSERFHVYTPDKAPDQGDLTDLWSAPSTLYTEDWFWGRPAAYADTAFGQGQLQVTPLQMAEIAQSIANDGEMLKPYLVESVRRPGGGEAYKAKPKKIANPMSSQVAHRMWLAMEAVVVKGWDGALVAGVQGYRIGGKSGTAENPHGAPHAWFMSIGPLDDPKYAVIVMVENGGEGTSVGGSIAGQVMAAALEINP